MAEQMTLIDTQVEIPAAFIFAGNATATIENTRTQGRFTYKVVASKDRETNEPNVKSGPWFVKVLNGPDNNSNYAFIGTVFLNLGMFCFNHSKKNTVTKDAQSFQVFEWLTKRLNRDDLPDFIEIHHSGRCGRCGRKLTVPTSIKSGLGPVCAAKGR